MDGRLNPNLRDFWSKKYRYRVLYGGRSGSKSHEFAGRIVVYANNCKLRILCVRQLKGKISKSVYSLIKQKINEFGLSGFESTADSITHKYSGSEFIFYGIRRNFDEIKSIEGIDILWFEEAHSLTEEQWLTLTPCVRKEGSEIWVSFNPNLVSDFVYQKFVMSSTKNAIVKKVNYTDNPYLSNTARREIEVIKEEDPELYDHIYLGNPVVNASSNSIIRKEWISAAIDCHLIGGDDWRGVSFLGFDVADGGGEKNDSNATAVVSGAVVVHLDEWWAGEDEILTSARKSKNTAAELKCTAIGYDSIGIGACVGQCLQEVGWSRHYPFNAGKKVKYPDRVDHVTKIKNKDYYYNLKAQAWWDLSRRFRNTYNYRHKGQKFSKANLISISSECDPLLIERLSAQLCSPKKEFDSLGRLLVESKKSMLKRGIPSTNLADALIIATSRPISGGYSQRDIY